MTRAAAEARPTADLLSFIADDRAVVSYRPRWNQLTGSITATILLQQLIYRWVQSGRRPFYKFTGPCTHPLCRPGDTWEEELGLTRRQFETVFPTGVGVNRIRPAISCPATSYSPRAWG